MYDRERKTTIHKPNLVAVRKQFDNEGTLMYFVSKKHRTDRTAVDRVFQQGVIR